ncbi:hypothetical protein HUJ05_000321 [Dendroctonus ponderosae]|nr:hypothetical protein HUJ05_000321 [Dendroctonus ponderosae]
MSMINSEDAGRSDEESGWRSESGDSEAGARRKLSSEQRKKGPCSYCSNQEMFSAASTASSCEHRKEARRKLGLDLGDLENAKRKNGLFSLNSPAITCSPSPCVFSEDHDGNLKEFLRNKQALIVAFPTKIPRFREKFHNTCLLQLWAMSSQTTELIKIAQPVIGVQFE